MSDITVMVNVHGRQGNTLRRLLEYYRGIGSRVIVADSSPRAVEWVEEFPGVEYQHLPGMSYIDKMYHVLDQVNTEAFVEVPDDDFVDPEFLEQASCFISENPGCSCVVGQTASFSQGRKYLYFQPTYFFPYLALRLAHAEGLSPWQRLDLMMNRYFALSHGIVRTTVIRDFFDEVRKDEELANVGFVERLFFVFVVLAGDVKLVEELYMLRSSVVEQSAVDLRREIGFAHFETEYRRHYPELDRSDRLNFGIFFRQVGEWITRFNGESPGVALLTEWIRKSFGVATEETVETVVSAYDVRPCDSGTPQQIDDKIYIRPYWYGYCTDMNTVPLPMYGKRGVEAIKTVGRLVDCYRQPESLDYGLLIQ